MCRHTKLGVNNSLVVVKLYACLHQMCFMGVLVYSENELIKW